MRFLATLIFSLTAASAHALNADDFNGLEGYSIAAVTKVDGDFEGCEYDRTLKLQNGWILTCQSYNYHYAYSPTVVVLARDIGRGFSVKAVIDDEMYDMGPILKK